MKHSKVVLYIVASGILLLLLGWLYGYNYHARAAYENSFQDMHDSYRKVLRGVERDRANVDDLLREFRTDWDSYYTAYRDDPPATHKLYANWSEDLDAIDQRLRNAEPYLITGDKDLAYEELHGIRMIWRRIWAHGTPKDYRFYIVDMHEDVVAVHRAADRKSEDGVLDACTDLNNKWRALKNKHVGLRGEEFVDYTDRVDMLGRRILDVCSYNVNIGRLPSLAQTMRNTYDSLYLNFG